MPAFKVGAAALVLQLAVQLLLLATGIKAYEPKPIPLVLPQSKTQLQTQSEGLDFLNSLDDPVAPVVVIGPYRSGKSFTLNQLLGVPCNQGFGVGHTRETETKGIWVWGEPKEKQLDNGGKIKLLYIDTEGFESTGRANSYDDRIFALSTIISSVLIYNLPETVRQSDISKLSFAVELAQGFYDRAEQDIQSGHTSLDPGSMLWLIQRDFLHGVTAAEMVRSALAPVPNPENDKDVRELNAIRESLTTIAHNSTGFSLVQPHLDRTKLCELTDAELDPKYVEQREALKALVRDLAQPKAVGRQTYTGRDLASLIKRMVDALNAQEIPNAASIVEAFNRELSAKALRKYSTALAAVQLPADITVLEKVESDAHGEAIRLFQASSLGRKKGENMLASLEAELAKEWKAKRTENAASSSALCSDLENKCEIELDGLQNMKLPSLRKFEAAFQRCEHTFLDRCRGPGKQPNVERMQRAWSRAKGHFQKEYNDKLYTGLIIFFLGVVVLFRFLFKIAILEGVGWVGFLFLQVYPYAHAGAGSMYDTAWWKVTVQVWESVIFVVFFFDGAHILWSLLLIGLIIWRLYRSRDRTRKRKKQRASGSGDERDLDV